MQREIVIVGYQTYDFAKSLVVGEIQFLDFDLNLDDVDCLIFTSKNAIRALNHNVNKYPQMNKWKQIPSYVIGEGSAKVLQEFGGKLEYVSPYSHGIEFAKEIYTHLKHKKCLYLRAQEIVSNLDQRLCDEGVEIVSVVAYQNKRISFLPKTKTPKDDSYLLFTSPSAYRFFCNLFDWNDTYVAVALGKTTFGVFDFGIQKMLSPFQNIQKSVAFLESQ